MALHDAQFVIAREQGFASWTKLKAYVAPSFRVRQTRLYVADMQWIATGFTGFCGRDNRLVPAALEQIRNWHPGFEKCSDEEIIKAPFTEADAQLIYAREHGFETWDDLSQRANVVASVLEP